MANAKSQENRKPLTPAEDLELFKATAARLTERVKTDENFARQVLNDVGYYKLMHDERRDLAAQDKATTISGASTGAKTGKARRSLVTKRSASMPRAKK